jgi:hypothetical protein
MKAAKNEEPMTFTVEPDQGHDGRWIAEVL